MVLGMNKSSLGHLSCAVRIAMQHQHAALDSSRTLSEAVALTQIDMMQLPLLPLKRLKINQDASKSRGALHPSSSPLLPRCPADM